jgi:hypothetical protein
MNKDAVTRIVNAARAHDRAAAAKGWRADAELDRLSRAYEAARAAATAEEVAMFERVYM